MNKLSQFTTIAACLVVLVFAMTTRVSATANVDVSHNGAESNSEVEFETSNKTEVKQENEADIENKVELNANTGQNQANGTTGGDVKLNTGKVNTTVVFANSANFNSALINSCCNLLGDTKLKLANNGAKSKQEVEVEAKSKLELQQENEADVENEVEADVNTGQNQANKGTDSNVALNTGKVNLEVGVENIVNSNDAEVETCGCEADGDVVIALKNNGTKSSTKVEVEVSQEDELDQDNQANVDNKVEAEDVLTGKNQSNKSTGGKNKISTGKVHFLVSVFNQLNLNSLKFF